MIPQDKDLQAILIGILLAAFGGLSAFLQGHEGKDLTISEFLKVLLGKLIVASFAGTVIGLMCRSLHLGLLESCMLASMAGYTNKEALDWLKEKLKQRIEQ